MSYSSLRDFLAFLERRGGLKRVPFAVDPRLEMTELCQRSLRASGPALWFERPRGHEMPVLGNLFGTTSRVAAALGYDDVRQLRELGAILSFLREPQWPDRPGMLLEKLRLEARHRCNEQMARRNTATLGPAVGDESRSDSADRCAAAAIADRCRHA